MTYDFEEHLATNFYYDRNFGLQAAKISPGEYYVTDENMMIVTVLGSCVSACVRDYRNGIGGMNHFMLPDSGTDDSGNPMMSSSARYGTYAMEILINHLLKMGAYRVNLEAKVFGGGNVLKNMTATNVGQRNADFVLGFLDAEKIRVVAQDLIDIYPRKVYYIPKTGKVMVKKIRDTHNNTIFTRERDYGSRLKDAKVEGDVELFG
jgi:chemotaxis protein CheD